MSLSIEKKLRRAAVYSMIAALSSIVTCALHILAGISYAVQGNMQSAYAWWITAFVFSMIGVIFFMVMRACRKNIQLFKSIEFK